MEKKVRTYESDDIVVRYDVRRCIHAERCVHGLPRVFDPERRPWIDPAQGEADAVAEVVMRCPTGALQFERKDGGAEEAAPPENVVTIEPGGPLYVHGDIELTTPEGTVLLKDTRVALCRCGASSNKPLCDNSHEKIGFDDPGTFDAQTNAPRNPEEASSGERLRVLVRPHASFGFEGPFSLRDRDKTVPFAKASFCRCGHSGNKPFCDGTHKKIGFTAE